MSRTIGIDFRSNHVRIAALHVRYRKLELEGLYEELLSAHESPREALRACLAHIPPGGIDTIVTTVDGARCFTHAARFPESAKKRLLELLPFELEAELPLDIDELVIDHTILDPAARAEKDVGPKEISVFAAAARIEDVQEVIDLVREASGKEPERVGVSNLELLHLTQLNPVLCGEEPIALMDLGFTRTDICLVHGGRLKQGRALSMGGEGFPEQAPALVARLRQTFVAYATTNGAQVARLYLLGEGAGMQGLPEYLAGQLGMPVEILDRFELDGVSEENQARLPYFGRALAVAMHGVRGKGLDLRQGALVYERGYEHVKQRAPLLAGLMAAVMLSFFFSIWAESRALAAEHEALLTSLEEVTKSTFGVETADPDEAEIELEKARKMKPEDPMPYLDGFGVAVALATTLPEGVVHDVEEFDVAKGKVKIRGLVASASDAQTVAKHFGEHPCIHEPNVTKITQVVNTERERYTLEADVYCPEDQGASKKKEKVEAKEAE
jgi:Tfp pilus assembly PilM family ATPase